MTNKPSWQKEFDKWFNHGTKKEPRFAYASGVYPEVKAFIQDLLDKKAREIEGLKDLKQKSDRWRYSAGEVNCFNQALDQAPSILKE